MACDRLPRVPRTCLLERLAATASVKSASSEIRPKQAVRAPRNFFRTSHQGREGAKWKVAGQALYPCSSATCWPSFPGTPARGLAALMPITYLPCPYCRKHHSPTFRGLHPSAANHWLRPPPPQGPKAVLAPRPPRPGGPLPAQGLLPPSYILFGS